MTMQLNKLSLNPLETNPNGDLGSSLDKFLITRVFFSLVVSGMEKT